MALTPTRQYGAAIALVSGAYSLVAATWTGAMVDSNSGLLMAALGVVVVIHGVVLLTPVADRLGGASGPLMVGYALVMLLNQALVATTHSHDWGMGSGMDGGMGMTGGMGWDLGMVALAVLMLVTGVVMTNQAAAGDGM